ncbi:MAG: zinc-ribbon domain-containing protein [Acidobacteriota bacterium]
MMFIFIVGTKYIFRDKGKTEDLKTCPNCGSTAKFNVKSGRNFLTLFFILPVFPIGGTQTLLECPFCQMRFSVPTD